YMLLAVFKVLLLVVRLKRIILEEFACSHVAFEFERDGLCIFNDFHHSILGILFERVIVEVIVNEVMEALKFASEMDRLVLHFLFEYLKRFLILVQLIESGLVAFCDFIIQLNVIVFLLV